MTWVLVLCALLVVLGVAIRRRYGSLGQALGQWIVRATGVRREAWIAALGIGTLVVWLVVWLALREDYGDRLGDALEVLTGQDRQETRDNP